MRSEERTAIALVLALLMLGTVTVTAVSPAAQSQPQQAPLGTSGNAPATVTVSATADAGGEAETATLHLASAATGDTASGATDAVAANVSQLRDALAAANVSEEQIRTIDYNLQQPTEGEPERPGPDRNLTEYRAEQGLAITIENTSRTGEILDVATANGATTVRSVQFGLTDETERELRDEALTAAMDDARSQAATVAASEGLELTGVHSVSTGQSPVSPATESAFAADAGGTVIDPGPVDVSASVTVTYNATGAE